MMKGMKKKKPTVLMIAMVLGLLLTACGGGGNSAVPGQGDSAAEEAGPADAEKGSNVTETVAAVGGANNTFPIKDYMLYGIYEYLPENPEKPEEEQEKEFISSMKFELREEEPGKYEPDEIGYEYNAFNASVVPIRIEAGHLLDYNRYLINQYGGGDFDLFDLTVNENWQKLYSNIAKEDPEHAKEIFSRIKNLYDTSVIRMEFINDEGKVINWGWVFSYVIENGVMRCKQIREVNEDLTISYYVPEVEDQYLVGFKDDSLILEKDGASVTLLSFQRASERRYPDKDNWYSMHGGAANDGDVYEDLVNLLITWDYGKTESDSAYLEFKDGSKVVDAKAERMEPNRVTVSWEEKWTSEMETINAPGQISFRYIDAYAMTLSTAVNSGFILIDDEGNAYPYMASDNAYFRNKMGDNLAEGTDSGNMDDEAKGKLVENQTFVVSKIEDAFQAAGENVEVDKDNGTVRFDTNILFASDSAELSEEGIEDLNRFLEVYVPVMKEQVQEGRVATISIDGHTDTRASYKHNQKLSEERAQAVAAYVIEADPELEEYITTKGFSYDKPIFAEDGSVDMDASRRVEFRFILKAE